MGKRGRRRGRRGGRGKNKRKKDNCTHQSWVSSIAFELKSTGREGPGKKAFDKEPGERQEVHLLRSPPCHSPGEYGLQGQGGEVGDTDTVCPLSQPRPSLNMPRTASGPQEHVGPSRCPAGTESGQPCLDDAPPRSLPSELASVSAHKGSDESWG